MEPPRPRVTLREIAQHLGVNYSTVSLALRNHPRISKATTERIQAAAAELGYARDPMLSALSHYRHEGAPRAAQGELAWLNHWPDPARLYQFGEFARCWKGAQESASENGFHLVEHRWQTPGELVRLQRTLIARNVAGILIPSQPTEPDWGDFAWDRFVAVRIGYSITNLPTHVVASDQTGASLLAIKELSQAGYQRIGFIYSDAGRKFRYHAGFLQGQMTLPVQRRLPSLHLGQTDLAQDQKRFEIWLAKYRPDVVLTFISEITEMLRLSGHKTPADIGIATFSLLDGNATTGINQHSGEIGRYAVEMLISLFKTGQRGLPGVIRVGLVEGSWVEGATTRDCKSVSTSSQQVDLDNAL